MPVTRLADRRRWVCAIALVVTATIVGLLLAVFDSVFMVNDDAAMNSFANGSYTGQPEAHLVFIGRLPGSALAALYRWAPNVPWYGVTLLIAQSACLAALAALIWARRRTIGWARNAVAATLAFAYVPVLTLTPTFTMTATVLTATGFVMVAFAHGASERTRVPLCGVAASLLAVGASVRWDAFLGTLVTLLPFVGATAFMMGRRRFISLAVVLAALLGAVHTIDTQWARSGAWSAYTDYNAVRGALHGTSQLSNALKNTTDPAMARVLDENDWTLDDLNLFAFWMFDDPDVYSQPHLTKLLDVTGDIAYTSSPGVAMRSVIEDRRALFALLAVCAGVGVAGVRRRRAALLVGQLLWAGAVFVVIAARLRLPDRVAVPNLFALSVVVLLWSPLLHGRQVAPATAETPRASRQWLTPISLGITLALLAIPLISTRGPAALSSIASDSQQRLQRQLAVLDRVDPHGRFVAFGAALDSAGVSPLDPDGGPRSMQVLEVGWATFSPHYEQRKRDMGLEGDLFTALVEQDGLYLIGSPKVIPILWRVYERRLQIQMSAEPLANMGSGISVFRLRRATSEEIAARTASERDDTAG